MIIRIIYHIIGMGKGIRSKLKRKMSHNKKVPQRITRFDDEDYECLLEESIEEDEDYIYRKEFYWEEMSYYRFELNGQNTLDYIYDEYTCGNWDEDIDQTFIDLLKD